ncbi:MAG: glycine cleavage system aminomethyltransferase GcvT [Candidatus Hodarchaeaceae archaeon]|nr:glycine cleavage system aminomethyltransferase GcvT [Candidatus Hodarchaeaceae archaeon]
MKKLHLARAHRSLGAQLVEFAGWEMPLKYTSVIEEHLAVREAVGLFDVSHMGEFSVRGPGALDFLQRVTSNDVSKLAVGGAQYSTVLNERGGIRDDVVVYRLGEQEFMVVCNAANVEKLSDWFAQQIGEGTDLKDITMTTVLLALQGPKAQQVLQPLTKFDLTQLKRFKAARAEVAGVSVLASRSGYTGEDGFELYMFDEPTSNPIRAEKLWGALLKAGASAGIKPCGLGARDTTRLEAGLCLYGNDLTEEITPLEARIDFVVKFEKGEFIGRTPLLEQKNSGLKRARVGLRMLEAGVPRQGYGIFRGDQKIGAVTSGTFSPLLKVGVAMGYAKPDLKVGDRVEVEIHGKRRAAEVVNWPFYDPAKYGHSRR